MSFQTSYQLSHQNKFSKFYCYNLKGSRYIFADERNKKKLLDIVFSTQKMISWEVYSFCVTDDCVYFVVGVSEEKILEQLSEIIEEQYFRIWIPIPFITEEIPYIHGEIVGIYFGTEKLSEQCGRIHRIPLEQGYVRCLGDYWWSSYITYAGIYDWHIAVLN